MSDCRWNGLRAPRTVPGRHGDECVGDSCTGCLVCSERHCRVCGRTHADGTCPECLASTRDDLRQLARMCGELPEEVEHRGINGEAMMLLGPACDPEARGHLEASILAGRVPADYLDVADGELHPLFVLGSWDAVWRDALEHSEPTERLTLSAAVDYLDQQMTYMGGFEHVPFEDFATELRQCRAHLESVLHDGEQVDTGAPCMTCRVPLERVWGAGEHEDGWKCPRCKQRSSEAQYRLAVMAWHQGVLDKKRDEATHLSDRDMEIRTGVKAGTVRVWAKRGDVERVTDSGRTLYSVADVMKKRLHIDTGVPYAVTAGAE